jgi:hypothetical protein
MYKNIGLSYIILHYYYRYYYPFLYIMYIRPILIIIF